MTIVTADPAVAAGLLRDGALVGLLTRDDIVRRLFGP